jgi:PAS domain S-box-containing protein
LFAIAICATATLLDYTRHRTTNQSLLLYFIASLLRPSSALPFLSKGFLKMAQLKPFLSGSFPDQFSTLGRDHSLRVQPDYVTVVNSRRRYVDVSPTFCKLLGYTRDELIGMTYDEITVPRTNDIPAVLEMFLQVGHMSGIWVLAHRGGTKLFVRYESVIRQDGLFESQMQLLAAGA